MNPRALILILLAGVGFILVFFLTRAFLASNTQPAQPTQQVVTSSTEIMVAAADLKIGTIISKDHLKRQEWPEAAITEGYYRADKGNNPDKKLIGKVVRYPIQQGTPMTNGAIVAKGERGFLAAILNPGMRAVTVPVNSSSGVAGFIFPGDRVDVIMTHRVRVSELPNVNRHARRTQSYNLSETILSNVRVLGVDQFSESTTSGVKVRKTATLEVTPKIAEKIAVMRRVGRLSLALRSLASSESAEPIDISTPPLDQTVSTTQAGELSQFLPKFDPFAKPPVKRQVIVNRGSNRSVVNLGQARAQSNLNEINSLPINSDFEDTQILQEDARPDRGDN